MASRIAGITIELNAKPTKLLTALKSVDSSLKRMKTGLRDVDRLLKFNPTSTTLLTQKQQLLRTSISQTKDRLKQLRDAMDQLKQADGFDENSDDAQRLQREIIATEQELKRLQAEYGRFASVAGAKMQAVGQKMMDVGRSISAIGTTLMQKVTVPIGLVSAVAVKKFAEVDKTMQLTNATMGNTAQQAELINQAMKDAAANSTFGMNDAATASLNFARAGLTAEQAAAALAPAMNLAAGEGGNLDTVSAGLVATINGFHGSFDDAAHYADVFANACNNSALDVDSLSEAMSVAAPIFAAAGYKVDDAALYMGIMANNGIEASVAANSLKTGFARLLKPTDEAAAKMEELGISMTNQDGTMKDTVTIQKELHDSFAQLSEAEQIAAAAAIFGKNQMAPWLALINSAPADVEELNYELKKTGTTTEMAQAMMGGFGGAIEKLKSSIDVAATSFGEALAPTIRKVADFIQNVVDKFNSLSKSQKESIAKWAMVAAAIAPVLKVVGTLTTGLGGLVKGFGAAISKIEYFGQVLGIAGAGTIAAGIAAVAALAGGMYALDKAAQASVDSQFALTEAERENNSVLEEMANKYTDSVKAAEESNNAIQSQYNYVRDLVTEYNGLVDANGKISEADKARADFIVSTLAQSLGMEKSQILDLVGANGQLTGAIDAVIQKKEAQAYLDANYDSYVKAIELQTTNTEKLANALQTVSDKEDASAAAKQRLADAQQALNNYLESGGTHTGSLKTKLENAQRQVEATDKALQDAKDTVSKYADASADASQKISNYEALKTAAQTGSIEEVNQAMANYQNNLKNATNATQQELQTQAETATSQYEILKAAYDSGQKGITQGMVDSAKKRMEAAQTEAGSVSRSTAQEKDAITTNLDTAQRNASKDFSNIDKAASTSMSNASRTVSTNASAIKRQFPINLGKLFTGTLTTIAAKIKDAAGEKSVRYTTGVQRFAKAYKNPYIFTSPALLAGNRLVGDRGGAYGGEMVYGRNNLMNDIREAVGGTGNVFNITVDGATNPEEFADRLINQIQLRSRTA